MDLVVPEYEAKKQFNFASSSDHKRSQIHPLTFIINKELEGSIVPTKEVINEPNWTFDSGNGFVYQDKEGVRTEFGYVCHPTQLYIQIPASIILVEHQMSFQKPVQIVLYHLLS